MIVHKASITPAWWRLDLASAELAGRLTPGQFLLLRCAGCYLRRPVFPAPVSAEKLQLLVRPAGDPGLAWLAARVPGDRLDVIGPGGKGFPLPGGARHLLLVSDGPNLSPLLGQMERAVAGGLSVTMVLGASRAAALYPLSALPPVVEVRAATLDGSVGHRGVVTDLLPDLLQWADLVCAVGSPALYRALRRQVEAVRVRLSPGFLYGLLVAPLACGVGACLGCAVEMASGTRLVCVDGPVVDLAEVEESS